MERAKLADAKKPGASNTTVWKNADEEDGGKPRAEKLGARATAADDLAPSFIKRRDPRCREDVRQAVRLGVADQDDEDQEVVPGATGEMGTKTLGPFPFAQYSRSSRRHGRGRSCFSIRFSGQGTTQCHRG